MHIMEHVVRKLWHRKKFEKKLVGEKLIGAASHSFSMGNSKIESENCWLIGLLIGLVTDSTSSAISLFLSDIAEEVEIYASLAT